MAKTKEQVQKQSSKERLWDQLNTAYGQQREESNEAYQKAFAQTGREMLKRGMQRSSYGAQTQANVLTEGNKAADKIYQNQIAAYQQGLNELEQRESDEKYRNAQLSLQKSQLAENKRQFNENLAYQREQAELNRAFTTSEREASQGYNTSEREAQQTWQSGENAANRKFTTSEREATQAYNTGEREAQQQYNSAENALNRAFQTSEREATQAYNTSERKAQQAYNTAEREVQQAYNTAERIGQQEFNARENEKNRQLQTDLQILSQNWQSKENKLDRDQKNQQFYDQLNVSKEQFEKEFGLKEKQLNTQIDQWEKEFGYQQASDAKKQALDTVMYAIGLGLTLSDAEIAAAGLSRADVEAMANQVAALQAGNAASGGGGGGYTPGSTPAWKNAGFASETEYKAAIALGVNTPTAYKDKQLQIQSQPDKTPYNPSVTPAVVQNSKAGQTVKKNILKPASSTTLAQRAASSLVKENKKKSGS